jgi:hypothetical protein
LVCRRRGVHKGPAKIFGPCEARRLQHRRAVSAVQHRKVNQQVLQCRFVHWNSLNVAIVEEFYTTREPWRWMHLVCGAQAAAISFGKNMTVYEEYLELLHAA